MKKSITAGNLTGKQILIMQQGKFHGDVRGILMDSETLQAKGFNFTDDTGNGTMLALDSVSSFSGDVVVTPDESGFVASEGKSIVDMPVVTPTGTLVGHVCDFEIDADGRLSEILVVGGFSGTRERGAALLQPDQISRMGEDVLLTNAETEALLFAPPEEGKYTTATNKAEEKKEPGMSNEEFFDVFGKKFSSSVNEIGSRLGSRVKQIDTEHLNQEINRLTENVNRELGRFVEGIMDQFPSRRRDFNDSDVMVIMKDLAGNTVSRQIYDKRGNIIIMPGQLITDDKVKQIIASEKVAELYRSAVPINQ